MKNIITIILLLIGFSNIQAHELKGTIISNSNNTPIEGVSVYNQTNGDYTYSNTSGFFKLNNVSLNDVIYFYNLGYATKQITITEEHLNTTIKVSLTESVVSLDQVVLVSNVNTLSTFLNVDVKTSPVKSSQEILRKVPGLIIGQHAGGGKAEQIFLRGFDIDHGTDVAISVDGLPVNMVSHAHGQGYADMHFIIPETVDNIDFGKGPYYANVGNFNTAGYVNLKTKKKLDKNLLSVEAGQFNSLRAVSMLKLLDEEQNNMYLASELVLTDGVFDSPQNFNRINLMGRYNFNNYNDQEFTITASHFQSKWDASGQIPQRAVDQGLIGRFGAIDDTEGGKTSRSNLWFNHTKQFNEHESLTSKAFVSKYDFELFSNFTFFLEDPVNGDQIKQKESRSIFGAESVYAHNFHFEKDNSQLKLEAGVGFRYDDVNDVELSHTANRQTTLETYALGDIDEVNMYSFLNATYKKNKWTINPGLRLDYFKNDYIDKLQTVYTSLSEDKVFVSPKLNFIYAASPSVQLFLKSGIGFHSNDTRVVTANNGKEILPAAYGNDLGVILKPSSKLVINAALWSLFLEQEFVYVGDAGVVEPSGKTQRYGVDLGFRYNITPNLYLYSDANYAYARSTEEADGEDYIPLAPSLTAAGGLTFNNLGKFSGGLNYRYVKDRPANEDNSIVADGYLISDFNLSYNTKNWTYGVIIENLFDTEWNESQFATETRLFNEDNPVDEIHFTPGTPFFLKAKVSVTF